MLRPAHGAGCGRVHACPVCSPVCRDCKRVLLTLALALTLTRCDWNEPGVVARTLERLRRALGFVDELARRAAALGALQGAVLQALLAWLAKEQQRLEEARRLAEPQEAGAEGHADPAEVAPSEVVRQTLSSADGTRDEPSPLLAERGDEVTRAMADAADDQDLKTAQQALAESAYFFVALQREADDLGVSADEQLKQYTF